MDILTLSLLGAGGYVVATADDDAPADPKPVTGGGYAATRGLVRPDAPAISRALPGASGVRDPLIVRPIATTGNDSISGGLPKEVEDELVRQAKAAWDDMSAEAKRQACEALKSEYPGNEGIQSLDCGSATFQQVLQITAAAVGLYVCGPPCSALGVLAAKAFGKDIEEWATKAWDGVTAAADGFKDLGEDVYDGITGGWW